MVLNIFGPYPNSGDAKETLEFIKQKFMPRQCKKFKSNIRPCLNYHIKRCLAPCVSYVSKEEYMKQIEQIIMFLEGKTDKILEQIDQDIKIASKNLEYEKAAILRDKKIAIENITEKQKVANLNENSIDIIGVARNEISVCIKIFFVRNSKMIGQEEYFFDNLVDEDIKTILSEFIKQYYIGKQELPSKIIMSNKIEDQENIKKILEEKANKKIEFKIPQKGEKLRFIEMAETNAKIMLQNRTRRKRKYIIKIKKTIKTK